MLQQHFGNATKGTQGGTLGLFGSENPNPEFTICGFLTYMTATFASPSLLFLRLHHFHIDILRGCGIIIKIGDMKMARTMATDQEELSVGCDGIEFVCETVTASHPASSVEGRACSLYNPQTGEIEAVQLMTLAEMSGRNKALRFVGDDDSLWIEDEELMTRKQAAESASKVAPPPQKRYRGGYEGKKNEIRQGEPIELVSLLPSGAEEIREYRAARHHRAEEKR